MAERATTVDSLLRAVARTPDVLPTPRIAVGAVIGGDFEILGEIGRGGIGVVYRAIDRRLGREVAIKVMRADRWARLSEDDRTALVEREARATARLRHPSIVTLHDIGEHEGVPYLVLELLHGDSLATRLRRPLPLRDAVALVRQVAAAVVHAHGEGVLHRDLKPHNVLVDDEGHAWVLDFGLAALHRGGPEHAELAAMSRAGTPAYMAPEQREGAVQDVRTDVWALGLLLYQVVTAYEPPPLASARELSSPPWRTDLQRLPPSAARVIDRAVAWRPEDRHVTAAAFLADLDTIVLDERAAPRRPWGWVAAVAVLAAVLALAIAWPLRSPAIAVVDAPAPSSPTIRFGMPVAAPEPFTAFQSSMIAVAPDGRTIVFQARPPAGERGTSQLWMRTLDDDVARPIEHTVDAEGPMFAPDGHSIAYAKDGELVRRDLAGGDAVSICAVHAGFRGGAWTNDGRIVLAPSWFSGLSIVADTGGELQPLTTLGPGEKSHRFPHVLPGDGAVLFVASHARTETFDDASIEAVSLRTGERTPIASGGAPRFVAPGTLLVPRHGELVALPFDAERLLVTGPPRDAVVGLVTAPTTGAPAFDVGPGATLAYFEGGPALFDTTVVGIAKDGTRTELPVPVRATTSVRRAPDGRLLLRVDAANATLWLHDVAREVDTRITWEWDADHAVFDPTGEQLYLSVTRGAQAAIVRRHADGMGDDEVLHTGINPANLDLSRDGKVLVFDDRDASTGTADLMWMPLHPPGAAVRMGERDHHYETQPALSPDGRHLAFTSSASGRDEIYVQPFPGPGARVQVSAHGGRWARWSDDGTEIVFRNGPEVLVAHVDVAPRLVVARPEVRLVVDDVDDPARRTFDLLPDGGLITVMRAPTWRPADTLRVVVGWSP